MYSSTLATRRKRPRSRTLAALTVVMLALVTFAASSSVLGHDAGRSDEHGTILLSFESTEEGCQVSMEARNVDVQEATLTIERPMRKGVATDHEEELQGTPEEGDGFRFEAGPFDYQADPEEEKPFPTQVFVLHWDDREHALSAEWSGEECASDPYLRVHEDQESGAVTEVQGCTVFIEGRHIRQAEGRLIVEEFHGEGESVVEVTDEDTAEDDPGHRFFVGPIELDRSGRHAARFFIDDEQHAWLSFWVVGCSTEPPECPENVEVHQFEDQNTLTWDAVQDAVTYRVYRGEPGEEMEQIDEVEHPFTTSDDRNVEDDTAYEYRVTAVGEEGESSGCPTVLSVRGERFECPPVTLEAVPNEDESVTIIAEGLDQPLSLLRSEDGVRFVQVAVLTEEEPTFRDNTTEEGVTYTYQVENEGETCASVDVTAIPVFPSAVVGAVAAIGGVFAYAAIRRRD